MKGIDLKQKRKNLNLSQTALAEKIGVSMRTIQNWEAEINAVPKTVDLFFENYTEFSHSENTSVVSEPTVSYSKDHLPVISKTHVPYYDVDFAGGWTVSEIFSQQKPLFIISNPVFERAEFACNLYGRSVSKIIPHSSVIGLRKVDDWQTYFPTNEIYGIVTKNDLRTVKFVKRSKDPDKLLLISSPEDSEVETEEIPIHFITAFFQVIAWEKFERLVN